ncbi:hypothetical protein ACQP1U_09605 [Actinomycetota bacterium]
MTFDGAALQRAALETGKGIARQQVDDLVQHSYALVVEGLPRAVQQNLKEPPPD